MDDEDAPNNVLMKRFDGDAKQEDADGCFGGHHGENVGGLAAPPPLANVSSLPLLTCGVTEALWYLSEDRVTHLQPHGQNLLGYSPRMLPGAMMDSQNDERGIKHKQRPGNDSKPVIEAKILHEEYAAIRPHSNSDGAQGDEQPGHSKQLMPAVPNRDPHCGGMEECSKGRQRKRRIVVGWWS